jgi:AraC-like DNA-binding protein
MKVIQAQITESTNSYISVSKRDHPFFNSPFHFHAELELVYVLEGYGKRIIGNTIQPFKAGDMVFIGSNLPHVWLNDEVFYREFSGLRARSIVVYFNSEVFGNTFYHLAEAGKLVHFFQQATRGISITGKTRLTVAGKLEKLLNKTGFDKILGLLEILHLLSNSKDVAYIEPETFVNRHATEHDRLAPVYQHIQQNYKEDISLTELAEMVSLTKQSFCRLFKKRTGKHFTEYLNDVRIAQACRYLMETDWSISQIAYTCGYKTIPNFNKIFREVAGTNPKAYREKANA